MENCHICGRELLHYDYVERIVLAENGKKYFIKVERKYCPICKKYKRILPDYLRRFKHYKDDIITIMVKNSQEYYPLEFENYPCESTIYKWKRFH